MAVAHETHSSGKTTIRRHIETLVTLSEEERDVLALALAEFGNHRTGDELIKSDAVLDAPRFVVTGWVCRAATLPDGRRQIVDFYIPGDLAGYSSRPGARAKAPYICLTNAVTVGAEQLVRRLRSHSEQYSGLANALLKMEDEIEQRLIDQIIRTGRMPAHERMAHLISDLHWRHQRVGAGLGNGFVMPLTQETLGDALGLSTVHVNRVLQQLRREQVIKTGAGRIEIANAEFLAAQAQQTH